MHSQVRQSGSGNCPKCGMALEPLVTTDNADTTELDDMSRRLWISVALSGPLPLISMSDLAPALNRYARLGEVFPWLQDCSEHRLCFGAGSPFFVRAWKSFRTWHLNMFSLIGMGTGTACLVSMVALLWPEWLPAAFKMNGVVPLYF